jgi:trans-aconitate methyltransferase
MSDSESRYREQLTYYREVADEYETHEISAPGDTELLAAIDSFTPTGDVLELACGTGIWTEGLIRSARSVTALDGAPEMLRRAQGRLGGTPNVTFIEADLFTWRPTRRYDTVFFGFWISHLPEDHFEAFWAMIDQALGPAGNVFFFDDNHRTEVELIEGIESPIVQRRLNNGKTFRVVKIPYQADQLEERLRKLGWNITVTQTSGPFYWGTGDRAR